MTQAEQLLWQKLRARRLCGLKFRRQHPLGPYIVDFYCSEKRLVIEVDGPIHNNLEKKDNERAQMLEQHNYQVIRFTNEQIQSDLQWVLVEILECT